MLTALGKWGSCSKMKLLEDVSTSPTLLREVGDWGNFPAWVAFRDRYDPLLRRWCRGFGIDADGIDEACQRIWIQLANRMRTVSLRSQSGVSRVAQNVSAAAGSLTRCESVAQITPRASTIAMRSDQADERETAVTLAEMEHDQSVQRPLRSLSQQRSRTRSSRGQANEYNPDMGRFLAGRCE